MINFLAEDTIAIENKYTIWLNLYALYLDLGKDGLKFIQSILVMEDKSTELCVNLYY